METACDTVMKKHEVIKRVIKRLVAKQGCRQGGEGGCSPQPPEILSSCYYVYKQLPQKDVQNFEKQERKNQFSGYKLCYTYKKYEFGSRCMQQT